MGLGVAGLNEKLAVKTALTGGAAVAFGVGAVAAAKKPVWAPLVACCGSGLDGEFFQSQMASHKG